MKLRMEVSSDDFKGAQGGEARLFEYMQSWIPMISGFVPWEISRYPEV